MYNKLIEMKRRMDEKANKATSGQVGTIELLVGIAITVVVLIALYSIIPIIGENLDSAASVGADSDWNSDVNSDIETGVGLWESIGPLITLAAIVSVLAVVILVIMQLRAR